MELCRKMTTKPTMFMWHVNCGVPWNSASITVFVLTGVSVNSHKFL